MPEAKATRPDGFGIFAYVIYSLVGGLLVFGFAWSLDGAVQTQERSVCRALDPEVRSRIRGVVLDAGGSPVAGAAINPPEQGPAQVQSEEDGTFVAFMPQGEQTFVVDAGGRRFEGPLHLQGANDLEVEVRLPDSGVGGELEEKSRAVLEAPEIQAQDLEGNPINLSDYRGKFVIVNFWATWCEPCITEWPQLDQLAKRLGDRDDVLILAVSIDNELGPIRPFLEQMSLLETEVGVVWDPTQEIHQAYGSEKIPDTFFVDEHGRLVQAFVNVRKWGSPEAFHCVDGSVGRSR
jgi:thiol-disulfide isomerase/thioredoxin